MSSNKRCNCCFDNEGIKRRRVSNIEQCAVTDKENIIQSRRSCGCGCARKPSIDLKSNLRCCQPSRNPVVNSQCCSANINQIKATVSGVESKVNVATRAPLGDLKVKSSNIQCCSSGKNCCGAVKKVTSTNTQKLNINQISATLELSTTKKNPRRSSTGASSSTQLYLADAVKPYKCCCAPKSSSSTSTSKLPLVQKSIISLLEQQPIRIPSKQDVKKNVNINDSYDYANISSNSDLSFHSPLESVEMWLTFKTNRFDISPHQSPHKEIENCIDDDSKLVSNNEPIQIIYDGIPSLRKKILKKQLSVASGYNGIVNLDPYANKVSSYVLYSAYMIDIIQNIIAKEGNLKIDKDLMKHSNIHPVYRTAVINWLIKLQVYLNSDASVFFICIRLFDKLLANIEIPQELLQLTGMITYWIANKYGDCVECLTLDKLQKISCGRYSSGYIINYERKILSLLNYNICVEEPIIFVRYYIYHLQIEDSNDLSFCANYLLDCLATSSDINTFPLSLQACAAVYLSLQFLGYSLDIWQKLEPYPGFYGHEDLYVVNEIILERMLLIQNENYEFREVFLKYANEKYNNISVRVCEGLKSLN